jgi:hypothetical protein
MSCLSWPAKDPQEILDFGLKWELRLKGDTIQMSTWAVPDGIQKHAEDFDDTITTIWLAGGVENTTYEFVNTVTTMGGRTHEQTVRLRCRTK